MHDSVSSPTPAPTSAAALPLDGRRSGAVRLLDATRSGSAGLFAARRPGERPPRDVSQTAALMFAAVPVNGLLAYMLWAALDDGVPVRFETAVWTLLVVVALMGLLLAALAIPVRRAAAVLWRTAQFCGVVALGVAAWGLSLAGLMADTPLLLAGLLVALCAIVVNIALWSTEVRRWCDV